MYNNWKKNGTQERNHMKEADFLRQFHIVLDPQQLAAMRAQNRHTLLLAVPGSGKTTVIVARTGYMLFCRGIRPENILTVTFSRAAAAEMRRRFRETFSLQEGEMPAFRTIHSLCRGILLAHCRETDTPLPELLPERKPLLRRLYLALFPEAEYPDDVLLNRLDSHITYIKNMLLDDEKIAAIEYEGIDFPVLYRAYERANREAGRMDFDDQLLMAYRLLRKNVPLLSRLRAQYPYINVDEAQDTSYIQHRILYLLAAPGELFMVGDEDQSIYGFRAAYPEIFLRFAEIYSGAELLRLETNYRSTHVIASAAGNFIRRNKNRFPKAMRAAREGGLPIRVAEFLHRKAQYAYLVKELASLPAGQTAAVLYRNNESMLPLLALLQEKGIAFEARGERAADFFSAARVRYALKVLAFALYPDSESIFREVYHRLNIFASKADLEAVLNAKGKGDLRPPLEVLASLAEGSRRENRIRERIAELRAIARLSPVRAVVEAWHVANGPAEKADDKQKIDILASLGEGLKKPQELLDLAEQLSAFEGGEAGANITLSTIHAAKGREFDRVYLIDLIDGVLPAERQEEDLHRPEEAFQEEEARLFYVGATRARDRLELIVSARGYCGALPRSPYVRMLTAQMKEKRG